MTTELVVTNCEIMPNATGFHFNNDFLHAKDCAETEIMFFHFLALLPIIPLSAFQILDELNS